MKSIFEMIINKDSPGEIIYEDADIIGLIDINPISKGHVLIIPKSKKENFFLEDDIVLLKIFNVSRKIKQAYEEVLDARGFKFNTNMNKEADQIVFHTHFHLIPFYEIKNNDPLSLDELQRIKYLLN